MIKTYVIRSKRRKEIMSLGYTLKSYANLNYECILLQMRYKKIILSSYLSFELERKWSCVFGRISDSDQNKKIDNTFESVF